MPTSHQEQLITLFKIAVLHNPPIIYFLSLFLFVIFVVNVNATATVT